MGLIEKLKSAACVGLATLVLNLGTIKAMDGSGTPTNPYKITNITELQEVKNNLSSFYILENNIDAYLTRNWNWDGSVYLGFEPIQDFSGNFDGKNNKINNLYINRPLINYVGLFGKINSGAEVKNVILKDVDIIGYDLVGVVAGQNEGNITNCSSAGEVEGHSHIGGLVGKNIKNISYCYSETEVNCYGGGGFVSWNRDSNAKITNCYAKGNVIGVYVGGFLYANQYGAEITNCYSTVSVEGTTREGGFCGSTWAGVYNNCFWDKDVNPTLNDVGNISGDLPEIDAKTTSQMKTKSTFTDSGWNFNTDETSVWDIVEGTTYPFLRVNNQLLNQAPEFYAIFAGEDEGLVHKFGVDADELYHVFLEYPDIDTANLRLISANNLETSVLEIIQKVHPKDRLLIYYSGHGNFDNNGNEPEIDNSKEVSSLTGESKNNGDEYLVFGLSGRKFLSDNDLTSLLSNLKMDQVKKIVILDSCMSGGFWGQPGNNSDTGDLDKLQNIGLIAACTEDKLSYSYQDSIILGDKSGRGIFSYSLAEKLKLGGDRIAPADKNRDGLVSFEELRDTMTKAYVMSIGDIGVIRTDPNNAPWLGQDIEVQITDSNNIPEMKTDYTDNFDFKATIAQNKIIGDINKDFRVNNKDFAIFSNYWMRTDCNDPNSNWCNGADINKTGTVDPNDLQLLSEHWLEMFFLEN